MENKRNKIPPKIIGSSTALQLTAKKQYAKMFLSRRQNGKSAGEFRKELLQMPQLWKDRRCNPIYRRPEKLSKHEAR